jgi:hypothetical protein
VAGYSGTPLAQKLGIKPGYRVALVNAPKDFATTLGELPEGVVLASGTPAPRKPPDSVICFVSHRGDLMRFFPALRARMLPTDSLWLCWPKKTSGVATDLTDHVIRQVALPTGLVDNKVCAIDATWSGLRLVVRLEHREPDAGARGRGVRKRKRSA